ncbi:MAG: NAD-dependent epimerase/dehydratase family protein [Chloroflexi bacterium]|nr:NAD-dependent epimerase/dehydratase family protein [Chloroflexota bacterium]
MKTLVLGGSRFIGLHLVRLLVEKGHEVSVLNRGQTSVDLPTEVNRLHADRYDSGQVAKALGGLSFDVAFDISGYDPDSLKPVLSALDGNVGRFVFCSTTAVYAPGHTYPVTEDFPLDRDSSRKYPTDKIACEDLLREAHRVRDFPVTFIRPPYVYGPDNYIAAREFSFFTRLSQGRKIIVPGDGLNLIHLVHVDDLAEAFLAAASGDNVVGEAYTIASPDLITTTGYVHVIADVMGVKPDIVNVEPAEYEALGQEFYPYEWRASQCYSTDKARRDLGWTPRYHMRDGLEMTYRWWVKSGLNKERWDFSAEDAALQKVGS